jgi:hypothetical protein
LPSKHALGYCTISFPTRAVRSRTAPATRHITSHQRTRLSNLHPTMNHLLSCHVPARCSRTRLSPCVACGCLAGLDDSVRVRRRRRLSRNGDHPRSRRPASAIRSKRARRPAPHLLDEICERASLRISLC